MKTLFINTAPYTAALYLRKCEEKRNFKACKRIDLFERVYRASLVSVAYVGIIVSGIAILEIAFILAK